jgi:hypothetical protein
LCWNASKKGHLAIPRSYLGINTGDIAIVIFADKKEILIRSLASGETLKAVLVAVIASVVFQGCAAGSASVDFFSHRDTSSALQDLVLLQTRKGLP